jgi:hypothetical protein
MKILTAVLVLAFLILGPARPLQAADTWIEVKSAHFVVVSNAGERSTRTLVWQLEQVRAVMARLWPWARVDLNKPLLVVAVKDDNALRRLAPQYWEKGDTRPAAVWVTGADRHYLAIRTDVEVETQGAVNPYLTAYFSYIALVMGQSLSPDLPMWLSRGLAGVLSNTLVRDDHIVVGAPIPWHLERLRHLARLPMEELVTITRHSPKLRDGLEGFDAQSWAFVHFLMFGDNRSRAGQLDEFAKLVSGGTDAPTAFRRTLGPPENFGLPFRVYFDRSIFQAARFDIDIGIEREKLPVRTLPPADAAGVRAAFLTATGRSKEARTAIAEARKFDPASPGSYDAEGLLLDRDRDGTGARTAFAKAVESGSSNAYVHYRLASLSWEPKADRKTLELIEAHLVTATRLNSRFADAYSWLGEIRAALQAGDPAGSALETGDPAGLVMRGISLEPYKPVHRARAAFVLLRQRKIDEAEVQAKNALTLADTEDDRDRAQQLLEQIAKAKPAAAARHP